MKKSLTIVVVVLIILTVAGGVYYFINPPNKIKKVDLSTLECSRVPNNIKNCPTGYFCNESVSGGLGPDGGIPIEHIRGDNKCYKICESKDDCTAELPNCSKVSVMIEDYSESEKVCVGNN